MAWKTSDKVWLGIFILGGGTLAVIGTKTCAEFKRDDESKAKCSQKSAIPQWYNVETMSIDQVFRDYDGYRLYSRDQQTGKVIEKSYYYQPGPMPVLPDTLQSQFKGLNLEGYQQITIYRDLKEKEQPFAKILEYTVPGCFWSATYNIPWHFNYVEIHLPENQGIEPGNDSWTEGKSRRYGPMHELK